MDVRARARAGRGGGAWCAAALCVCPQHVRACRQRLPRDAPHAARPAARTSALHALRCKAACTRGHTCRVKRMQAPSSCAHAHALVICLRRPSGSWLRSWRTAESAVHVWGLPRLGSVCMYHLGTFDVLAPSLALVLAPFASRCRCNKWRAAVPITAAVNVLRTVLCACGCAVGATGAWLLQALQASRHCGCLQAGVWSLAANLCVHPLGLGAGAPRMCIT